MVFRGTEGGRNIIYIVTGPKHGKACMDGGTQKNK